MADPQPPAAPKWMFWTGWVVTALPVLALLPGGVVKVFQLADVGTEFKRLGYPDGAVVGIGIAEITCTVLYLIPQSSVLGAILLTGYLGGATASHVRLGEPFYAPIIVGVLVWLGLFLRDSRLRALIPLRR